MPEKASLAPAAPAAAPKQAPAAAPAVSPVARDPAALLRPGAQLLRGSAEPPPALASRGEPSPLPWRSWERSAPPAAAPRGGESHEHRADRAAEHAIGGPLPEPTEGGASARAAAAGRRAPHLGGGAPLDPQTRARMERAFAFDFGGVRIHTGAQADRAARSFSARAYTAGEHIVFRGGQYAPTTRAGQALLAHELAHVVQQALGLTDDTVQLSWWDDLKEAGYKKLIDAVKSARTSAFTAIRAQRSKLPASAQGAYDTLVDICDEIVGVVLTIVMTLIGMVVGFGQGIVEMVWGLIQLVYGIIYWFVALFGGFIDNGAKFEQFNKEIIAAAKAVPAALKKTFDDWVDKFNKAPTERQSAMIGELTGQILAIIATIGLGAAKVGSLPRLAGGAARLGAGGTLVLAPAAAGVTATDVAMTAAGVGVSKMVGQGTGGGSSDKEEPKKAEPEPKKAEPKQEASGVYRNEPSLKNSDWGPRPEGGEKGSEYARKITGGDESLYVKNLKQELGGTGTVEFDGYRRTDKILLDAKAAGESSIYDVSGYFDTPPDKFAVNVKAPNILKEAQRQGTALMKCGAAGIEWHISNAKVAESIRKLFATHGYSAIKVIHTPP